MEPTFELTFNLLSRKTLNLAESKRKSEEVRGGRVREIVRVLNAGVWVYVYETDREVSSSAVDRFMCSEAVSYTHLDVYKRQVW